MAGLAGRCWRYVEFVGRQALVGWHFGDREFQRGPTKHAQQPRLLPHKRNNKRAQTAAAEPPSPPSLHSPHAPRVSLHRQAPLQREVGVPSRLQGWGWVGGAGLDQGLGSATPAAKRPAGPVISGQTTDSCGHTTSTTADLFSPRQPTLASRQDASSTPSWRMDWVLWQLSTC